MHMNMHLSAFVLLLYYFIFCIYMFWDCIKTMCGPVAATSHNLHIINSDQSGVNCLLVIGQIVFAGAPTIFVGALPPWFHPGSGALATLNPRGLTIEQSLSNIKARACSLDMDYGVKDISFALYLIIRRQVEGRRFECNP